MQGSCLNPLGGVIYNRFYIKHGEVILVLHFRFWIIQFPQ